MPQVPFVCSHREAEMEDASSPKDARAEAHAMGQGLTGYESLSLWQTVVKFKWCSVVCFLAAISAATEGYQIGLIGNIVANPGFSKQFGTQKDAEGNTVLAASVMSVWGVLGSVGQIVGQVSLPFVSGRFGRKVAMFTYWFILAISVAIECVAKDWKVWSVSKVFGGIGVGCMQATIPAYITEVAPTRSRGAFLMCFALWWITGQFFAPVSLQVMSSYAPNDFRTPILGQWGQIGLMFIIYLIIPESPAWCASRGLEDRAKKALRFLYRGVDDFDFDYQYELLALNIEHEKAVAAEQRSEKWWAIFKGTNGLRTLISSWTLVTQQFIGLGIFFSYGTYFFQQAGVDDPFMITCITSSINIATAIAMIWLADTIGRRWLATTGTSLCWVCCVVVGILGVAPQSSATNIVLVLFACFWNIGLVLNSATGGSFIGEVSSQRLRHYTAGFAMALSCTVAIVMQILVPYMINATEWNWGLKAAWFFAGTGVFFTVAMWFLIPETAGRSSAELDELFERKIKPWQFHKTTTATQRILQAEGESAEDSKEESK
ncbi:general substrate transporter [Dactylonectria macrodidyma]|uniref:General substrate transporter n=1 Tax=Dactylonectria macrodidyma TaxID=307937 RepID=A0A9P9DHF8_9HYPO|nr:general substrate transporter [Dactylonectria macrodidyma]